MSKFREFWIKAPYSGFEDQRVYNVNFLPHDFDNGAYIRVIEHDAVKELETKLQKCVGALEFYAKAWELGFYTGELLVRKCSSNDAFEEVHERARSVLAELKDEGEKYEKD